MRKHQDLRGIDARCSVCGRTLALTSRGRFVKSCSAHPSSRVRWRASVSAPRVAGGAGERFTATFDDEQEARSWLLDKRAELASTGSISRPSGAPLHEAVERWVESRSGEVAPNTAAAYRRVVPHIEAHPTGHIPVDRLTRENIRAMYSEWMTEASPRSVKQWSSVVSGCLAELHADGLIHRNPAFKALVIPKDTVPEGSVKSWSGPDRDRFLHSIDGDPLEALWRLMAWSGVRRGEALALRWSDLDLEDESFTVTRNLVSADRHGTVVMGRTKTGRERTAFIEETTVISLRALKLEQAQRKMAAFDWFDGEGDLIFTRANGVPLSPPSVSTRFSTLTDRLGLPRIGLHGLRHTAISLGVDGGVSSEEAQAFAGHSSPTTTAAYTHRQHEAGRGVIEALKRKEA